MIRRIKRWIKHIEPAFDRLVAAGWRYQEIASASCGDIGHPDGFRLITFQFLSRGLQKLDRGRTAQRLDPKATARIDMAAWRVTRRTASRIGENYDRKFQTLGLVHSHHPHTFNPFFDDRGLIGFAPLGVGLEFLDEASEGGSATLKMPSHVDQSLTIRERLLTIWPESNAGMGADSLEQIGDCLGDRPIIAPNVKAFEDPERVSDIDRCSIERRAIEIVHRIQTADF
jgi:hypothetical protein